MQHFFLTQYPINLAVTIMWPRVCVSGKRISILLIICVSQVMEHPQTVLLNKVLQSNISLGNAHANKSEHSKIVRLWMDLQQSVNVLFDSKTAAGKSMFILSCFLQIVSAFNLYAMLQFPVYGFFFLFSDLS